MAKRNINKVFNKYIDEKIKEVKKEFKKTVISVNKDLAKEASRMYDSFIDQYYSYKTVSYIRHGESRPGTQRGINLYRANDILKTVTRDAFVIDINANDMEDKRYQKDSKEFVLDNILYGYRGVPNYWLKEWIGTYEGKYFSYTGTPIKAFKYFNDYVVPEVIMQEWHKRGF